MKAMSVVSREGGVSNSNPARGHGRRLGAARGGLLPWVPRKWRRVALLGAFVVAIMVVAVLAFQLAPRDPGALVSSLRLKPPGTVFPDGTIAVLGTDAVGRDVFSRIIVGTRQSLLIGVGSVIVAAALGTILGVVSGYLGGWLDNLIMRVVDVQMAFPSILLALALTAALGPSLVTLVVALGVTYWTSYARLTRGSVLAIREREYVLGARVSGATDLRIMFRHILPNATNPSIILATLHLGQMIITESSLSYLGLGIQPPDVSWGSMIADGRNYLSSAWWAATFPGLAIALTVLIMGLFGDAMRDALDPRFRAD